METIYLYQEYAKNGNGFSVENKVFESEESAQFKLLDFIDTCKDLFEHEQILRTSARFWGNNAELFAKIEKLQIEK